MIEQTMKKCNDINGILTMISGNDNSHNKRNLNLENQKKLLTMTSDNKDAEQKATKEMEKVGNCKNNPNLLLFGQYSMSASTTTAQKSAKERHCIGCTPGGLTATALNMNLSAIGPLCTNVGCIGASFSSKDANSSNRVSRSTSPAPGTATENARLIK